MMSSPDNINVEISTSSSSGNLRQLAAAAAAAAAVSASTTTAAGTTTTGDGINNVAPASSSSTMTAQHQQNSLHHQSNKSGSGHAAVLNNNFLSNNSSNNEDDYAAWMIGSTEGLARARAAAAAAAAVPPAAGSLPNQLWQINLNSYNNSNNNDNNIQQRPLSVASPTPTESTATTTPSLSAGSSPPPPSSSPPTLGGLSQQHHMTHGANMHPPLPHPPPYASSTTAASSSVSITNQYHSTLLTTPTPHVESLLSTICETLNFDIAEMWLRTGPKTHQLTHSHVRPTALDEDIRQQLVDVYYGERSAERTHRLSPALCKRAKEAGEVVWVTAQTRHGAEALKCSISDVRTAVAVPVCHTTTTSHDGSGVNVTIIYFSIRRAIMKPQAVEFLVHMSLAVAVASVNSLAEEIHVVDSEQPALNELMMGSGGGVAGGGMGMVGAGGVVGGSSSSGGVVVDPRQGGSKLSKSCSPMPSHHHHTMMPNRSLAYPQGSDPRTATPQRLISVTGAQLNLQWESLRNVEYLTDGGNNWIHTAVLQGKSVVVKTLKPECQDVALAINEIEGELEIHSRLDHPNIVKLIGAGFTPRGVRFVVLERLDGGTLTQLLGYDTRIRDRRRRFWTKKKISYMDVLKCARSLAEALAYCHGRAIPNAMVLHRDLKPDNVGEFTLSLSLSLRSMFIESSVTQCFNNFLVRFVM